jgi:hypothetical protein
VHYRVMHSQRGTRVRVGEDISLSQLRREKKTYTRAHTLHVACTN